MRKNILFILLLTVITSINCNNNHIHLPDKISVKNKMQQVADWQIKNFIYSSTGSPGYLHDYGIDAWTNGVLYLGMSEWSKIADNKKDYLDWLYNIGNENEWRIPKNFIEHPKYSLYHADELCIGQFYLNMYEMYKENKMLDSTKERVNWIMNNPPDESMSARNKQSWTWCDALFMAPPVYIRLFRLTQDENYLTFMDRQFKNTYNHLYDKEEKLFFRDDSYLMKKEENGEKVFWGRGNGWVAAGIANILNYLPQDSPYKTFYVELFKEHIERLVQLSDSTGYWHASLLDPLSYPSPETSATALITYAIAYGINNDLLQKDEYLPHLIKSWNALTNSIDENGKLGWVQPIGANPRKVTKDMTAVYGVGAFLLAGCEIYKLFE